MNTNRIRSIVIAGGGTAGWMTAASLAHHFVNQDVTITLIESSDIGTVGVGEATIPSIRRFYRELGLNDQDVMRFTGATAKLAIKFTDWYQQGSSFYHPFGIYGQQVRNTHFVHYWRKLYESGDAADIGDYSLAVTLAKNHKFTEPFSPPPNELATYDWALHFDASKFAELMAQFATNRGVKVIDAKIDKVNLRDSDGFIQSLQLDNGALVEGELFIDCTGFRGVLIEQALNTGYEDWQQWLKCDRAVAIQSDFRGAPAPYTESIAHRAGWQWRVPLQHRQGNGHVYSSAHISEDEATATLLDNINGKALNNPRSFRFTPGRRKQAWNKNCIAVGLASGFLEPLESTSIALVETAIDKIKLLMPNADFNPALRDEFNDMTRLEYERVRDFIILHYKLNQRSDSKFWIDCREMDIPQTLQHKIDLFKARGHFVKYRWEIFQPASWLSIFSGNQLLPDTYDPMVDNFDMDYLKRSFAQMQQSLQGAMQNATSHEQYIAQHCAINPTKTSKAL
ncbi:tryptophan 7-halogenase [Alteromonadaceae bacterium BrNp21-10]|nr:tryptophan 7-halogenase [Alteromonadaceae bacterium BrNp21-10]